MAWAKGALVMAVAMEFTFAETKKSCYYLRFEWGSPRIKNIGSPVMTAKAKNPLNPLLGSSCGARKACSISAVGDHHLGLSGFEDEMLRVLRDTKRMMTAFDCANEAMMSDNFRDSA